MAKDKVREICKVKGLVERGTLCKADSKREGAQGKGRGRPPGAENGPCRQPPEGADPRSSGSEELNSANSTNRAGVGFSRVFPRDAAHQHECSASGGPAGRIRTPTSGRVSVQTHGRVRAPTSVGICFRAAEEQPRTHRGCHRCAGGVCSQLVFVMLLHTS